MRTGNVLVVEDDDAIRALLVAALRREPFDVHAAVNGADAVVNLAGANLGDARWTPQRKAILRDSRILPTRSLAAAITESPVRPPVFISASTSFMP